MLYLESIPLLKKEDCWVNGNKNCILFNAYKVWKFQRPIRQKVKEAEMLKTLKEMNT